jgi:hypothetical protein
MLPPDLFVVCKNPDCGAEVSPYVTECPYCGTRLQKRAPKLDKGLQPVTRTRPAPAPFLGRLRSGEMPGIRADRRPYATAAIVVGTCGVWVASRGGYLPFPDVIATASTLSHSWWRVLTTPFAYFGVFGSSTSFTGSAIYQFAALFTIALFGWLVERRHGPLVVLALFAIGACGGTYVALELQPASLAVGGNGGALALLCAWIVPDLLARRRGHDYDGDLLGAGVIALVMLAMPIARPEASAIAGGFGVLTGYLAGLALSGRRRV